MRLEDWSIKCRSASPYTPPELMGQKVSGAVYGSRWFKDGERITTSVILRVDGSQIQTASGSLYYLGEPSEDYVRWCLEQGCHVPTPEEPIKLVGDE